MRWKADGSVAEPRQVYRKLVRRPINEGQGPREDGRQGVACGGEGRVGVPTRASFRGEPGDAGANVAQQRRVATAEVTAKRIDAQQQNQVRSGLRGRISVFRRGHDESGGRYTSAAVHP